MLKTLRRALMGGIATNDFPAKITDVPDGSRGKPVIDFARCTACDICAEACPTQAIRVDVAPESAPSKQNERIFSLNYGDCIFCGECATACPDVVEMSKEHLLATPDKSSLTTRAHYSVGTDGVFAFAGIEQHPVDPTPPLDEIGARIRRKARELFGRSLHIREVDAGSCNGCEVEISALNNPVYDVERFGIHFVASPRHADMLLVTGPVTRNMEIALKQVYDATPDPKLVVAVGACAIGGGIFGTTSVSCGGVDTTVPVDVYIPGCPPRPEALLHGILLAIDRFPAKPSAEKGLEHS